MEQISAHRAKHGEQEQGEADQGTARVCKGCAHDPDAEKSPMEPEEAAPELLGHPPILAKFGFYVVAFWSKNRKGYNGRSKIRLVTLF